ncbi:MAG: hypothetical protein K8R92_11810 [Planctomycetes bacterium]|nr:hypothetical protein [Planctomycetota bacterium]
MKNSTAWGLVFFLIGTSTVQADVITLHNSLDFEVKLSDLIVWAEDGTQEVILKPGTSVDASADDDMMAPGSHRVFVTTITVKKYFLSCKSSIGTVVNEFEWRAGGDMNIIGSTSMLQNLVAPSALHCSVELGAGFIAPPPPPGQIFNVVNGHSTQLPGWFIGTIPDFVNGEILNPFTGPALVLQGSMDVKIEGENVCSADLNGDDDVDGADAGLLLLEYGSDPANEAADLNQDGMVDGGDMGLMLLEWGPCPQ